jgi:hypothetical protein
MPVDARFLLAPLALSLALLSPTFAGTPAVPPPGLPRILLDRELRAQRILLLAVDSTSIRFVDNTGLQREEPASRYSAIFIDAPVSAAQGLPEPETSFGDVPGIRPWDATSSTPEPGLLTLNDGIRYIGVPVPTNIQAANQPEDDTVLWQHPQLGLLRFKLDDVRQIQLAMPSLSSTSRPAADAPAAGTSAAGSAAPRQTDDQLLLMNGDVLSGFLESLADPLLFNVAGKTTSIPLDRVASISIPGPAAPAKGPRLWLSDSSIVRLTRLDSPGDLIVAVVPADAVPVDASLPLRPVEIPLASVAAIAFDAASIIPLSSIELDPSNAPDAISPPSASDPGALPLGIGDLEWNSPGLWSWTLPAGATRFAATILMPPGSWEWGSCTVAVEILPPGAAPDPKPAASQILNWRTPTIDINLPIPASAQGHRLVFRIEPGPSGPVQDRIVLQRPVFAADPVKP